uniref:Uncharacterized protein n=1 Tax=Romanomermis culicivorax TaxID=13658 RepID=A0A915KIE7_ROMCU
MVDAIQSKLKFPSVDGDVGEHGYHCLRYQIILIANAQSAAEKRFNRAQAGKRGTVERLSGVLERRFPC